jgi:glucose-6-phosphate isomerase
VHDCTPVYIIAHIVRLVNYPYTTRMKLHIDTATQIDQAALSADVALLAPSIAHLSSVVEQGTYVDPASSINLPSDETLLAEVRALAAQKRTPNLKYIFLVGIGGSNLGTKALYDALYGMHNALPTERPKILFVDTTSATMLGVYVDEIIPTFTHKDEYLLVTISKSGGTTETLANTEILIDALHTQCGEGYDRVVRHKPRVWHALRYRPR